MKHSFLGRNTTVRKNIANIYIETIKKDIHRNFIIIIGGKELVNDLPAFLSDIKYGQVRVYFVNSGTN